MNNKTFTAAVVGLGNIGLGYDLAHDKDYVQTHTKAYLNHKGIQLSFGVDPDSKKRKAFERFSRCAAYSSLDDASKDFPSVDIISFCVAPEDRGQLWDTAARMRPKVVVLEKPLAKKVSEGKQVLSWAKKNKIALAVNYLRRFEPSTYVLKAALEKRRLGKTLGVDIRYNGGFFNNASHYIDLMILFFGKPKKVCHTRVKKAGGDVHADFVMEYPSFHIQGRSIEMACPVGEITFWCDNGKFFYQKFGQRIDIFEAQPDPVFRKFNELAMTKTIETTMAYAMKGMADNIFQFCRDKEKLLSDGQSAMETLELCGNILSNL